MKAPNLIAVPPTKATPEERQGPSNILFRWIALITLVLVLEWGPLGLPKPLVSFGAGVGTTAHEVSQLPVTERRQLAAFLHAPPPGGYTLEKVCRSGGLAMSGEVGEHVFVGGGRSLQIFSIQTTVWGSALTIVLTWRRAARLASAAAWRSAVGVERWLGLSLCLEFSQHIGTLVS
jgi:hypothetical protein